MTDADAQEVTALQNMGIGTSPLRESGITTAKYMRWKVGEDSRAKGAQIREEIATWAKEKQAQRDQQILYGEQLKANKKDQSATNKTIIEGLKDANLAQGKAIKAEGAALKQARSMAKAQHEYRGRQLAKLDMEQRERIKQVRGEGSVVVKELTAKVKAEELKTAEQIEAKKKEIAIQNRAEVLEVKKQTADEVTDASKKLFFEKRKSIAENTRQAEASWMSEREQNKTEFLARAEQNKQQTYNTRAKAKQIKEEIILKRQQEAAKSRKEQEQIKETLEKIATMSATGSKGTHDKLYRNKYVSADVAQQMVASPYYKSLP